MVAEPGPATDGLVLEQLEGFPVDSAVSESRDSSADDSMPRKLHRQDKSDSELTRDSHAPNRTLETQTRTVRVRQDWFRL